MRIIVDRWAWLSKADLSVSQLAALRRNLTVVPKKYDLDREDPKPLHLFTETHSMFGVAREYALGNLKPHHQVELNVSNGDKSTWPGLLNFCGVLRPEQDQAVTQIASQFMQGTDLGGLLQASPGFGKCLAPDTPVLLYSGVTVRADQLRAGMKLLGPDSRPRTVLSTNEGTGPRYRIVPTKGDPWVCNDAHILTLVHSGTNSVRDVCVEDWLREPTWSAHRWKLFQPDGGIDFAPGEQLPLDPYFLGVWFGDGTKALNGVAISKPDAEIRDLCTTMAAQFGLHVREELYGTCPTFHLAAAPGKPNPLLRLLKAVVGQDVLIPHAYLTASRADRAAFLAGMLDTDGYQIKGCYDLVQKRKDYAEAVCFIARSLGARAVMTEKVVNGDSYWRVALSGDLTHIPMRIERKKCPPRKQIKNVNRTGFRVEAYPAGPYFGFTLDGDGRFLLGDFTVTHNTVCASALMARLQVPTLVVVHKEFLMSQWQQRLTQFLPGIQIGICQQDVLDYHGKHVVIGMVHTLADRTFSDEFIRWPGLVITDEVHRVGAATWSVVPSRFPARWRFGITATPRRKDGAEKVFQFHIGRILFAAKEQRMRPKIKRVHTTFRVVPTPNMSVGKMPRTLLVTLMCASPARTALIANQAVLAVQAGRKVLLLSERLGHLESIHKTIVRLWPAGAGALPSIDYYVGGRTEAERTVAAKATVILATSQFASEALDIPALDTLILSTPMSDVEQAVGRILRPSVGKKEPIVVDIRDDRVPLFKAFGDKRDRLYEKIA